MLQVVLIHINSPIAAILRTCAQPVRVHLVGPLGFEISDRYLKRAGLDYWPYVSGTILLIPFKLTINNAEGDGSVSAAGSCSYIHFQFQPDDWLLFGSENWFAADCFVSLWQLSASH